MRSSPSPPTPLPRARGDQVALAVRVRRESPGQFGRVEAFPGDGFHALHAQRLELVLQIAGGVGKLGKDQQLFLAVPLGGQLAQLSQLGVPRRLPGAAVVQHRDQRAGVLQQVPGQGFGEQGAGQPLEALFIAALVGGIRLGGAGAKIGLGAEVAPTIRLPPPSPPAPLRQGEGSASSCATFIVILGFQRLLGILILIPGIQQFRALRSERKIQAVFQGVQKDEVAQDMALDGRARTPGRRFPAA